MLTGVYVFAGKRFPLDYLLQGFRGEELAPSPESSNGHVLVVRVAQPVRTDYQVISRTW
jgi:hypothetical protein